MPQDYTPTYGRNLYGNYDLDQLKDALAGSETADQPHNGYGTYRTDSGVLGRYQFSPKTLDYYAKKRLGRSIAPEEFLKSPKLQEQIANDYLQDLIDKHGDKTQDIFHDWIGRGPVDRYTGKDPSKYAEETYQRYLQITSGGKIQGATPPPVEPQPEKPEVPGVADKTTDLNAGAVETAASGIAAGMPPKKEEQPQDNSTYGMFTEAVQGLTSGKDYPAERAREADNEPKGKRASGATAGIVRGELPKTLAEAQAKTRDMFLKESGLTHQEYADFIKERGYDPVVLLNPLTGKPADEDYWQAYRKQQEQGPSTLSKKKGISTFGENADIMKRRGSSVWELPYLPNNVQDAKNWKLNRPYEARRQLFAQKMKPQIDEVQQKMQHYQELAQNDAQAGNYEAAQQDAQRLAELQGQLDNLHDAFKAASEQIEHSKERDLAWYQEADRLGKEHEDGAARAKYEAQFDYPITNAILDTVKEIGKSNVVPGLPQVLNKTSKNSNAAVKSRVENFLPDVVNAAAFHLLDKEGQQYINPETGQPATVGSGDPREREAMRQRLADGWEPFYKGTAEALGMMVLFPTAIGAAGKVAGAVGKAAKLGEVFGMLGRNPGAFAELANGVAKVYEASPEARAAFDSTIIGFGSAAGRNALEVANGRKDAGTAIHDTFVNDGPREAFSMFVMLSPLKRMEWAMAAGVSSADVKFLEGLMDEIAAGKGAKAAFLRGSKYFDTIGEQKLAEAAAKLAGTAGTVAAAQGAAAVAEQSDQPKSNADYMAEFIQTTLFNHMFAGQSEAHVREGLKKLAEKGLEPGHLSDTVQSPDAKGVFPLGRLGAKEGGLNARSNRESAVEEGIGPAKLKADQDIALATRLSETAKDIKRYGWKADNEGDLAIVKKRFEGLGLSPEEVDARAQEAFLNSKNPAMAEADLRKLQGKRKYYDEAEQDPQYWEERAQHLAAQVRESELSGREELEAAGQELHAQADEIEKGGGMEAAQADQARSAQVLNNITNTLVNMGLDPAKIEEWRAQRPRLAAQYEEAVRRVQQADEYIKTTGAEQAKQVEDLRKQADDMKMAASKEAEARTEALRKEYEAANKSLATTRAAKLKAATEKVASKLEGKTETVPKAEGAKAGGEAKPVEPKAAPKATAPEAESKSSTAEVKTEAKTEAKPEAEAEPEKPKPFSSLAKSKEAFKRILAKTKKGEGQSDDSFREDIDATAEVLANMHSYIAKGLGEHITAEDAARIMFGEKGLDAIKVKKTHLSVVRHADPETGKLVEHQFETEAAAKEYVNTLSPEVAKTLKTYGPERRPYSQPGGGATKSAEADSLGRRRSEITIFGRGNATTVVHEYTHAAREFMRPEDIKILAKQFNGGDEKNWGRDAEEGVARAVEGYLYYGKSNPAFTKEANDLVERMAKTFGNVYNALTAAKLIDPADLHPETKALMDRFLFGQGEGVERPVTRPVDVDAFKAAVASGNTPINEKIDSTTSQPVGESAAAAVAKAKVAPFVMPDSPFGRAVRELVPLGASVLSTQEQKGGPTDWAHRMAVDEFRKKWELARSILLRMNPHLDDATMMRSFYGGMALHLRDRAVLYDINEAAKLSGKAKFATSAEAARYGFEQAEVIVDAIDRITEMERVARENGIVLQATDTFDLRKVNFQENDEERGNDITEKMKAYKPEFDYTEDVLPMYDNGFILHDGSYVSTNGDTHRMALIKMGVQDNFPDAGEAANFVRITTSFGKVGAEVFRTPTKESMDAITDRFFNKPITFEAENGRKIITVEKMDDEKAAKIRNRMADYFADRAANGQREHLYQDNEDDSKESWYTTKSHRVLNNPKLQLRADGTFKSGILAKKEFSRLGVSEREMEILGTKALFDRAGQNPVSMDEIKETIAANMPTVVVTPLGVPMDDNHPAKIRDTKARTDLVEAFEEYNIAYTALDNFRTLHDLPYEGWGGPLGMHQFPEVDVKDLYDEYLKIYDAKIESEKAYNVAYKESEAARIELKELERPTQYAGHNPPTVQDEQVREYIFTIPDLDPMYQAHHFWGGDLSQNNVGWIRSYKVTDSEGSGEHAHEIQSDAANDLRELLADREINRLQMEDLKKSYEGRDLNKELTVLLQNHEDMLVKRAKVRKTMANMSYGPEYEKAQNKFWEADDKVTRAYDELASLIRGIFIVESDVSTTKELKKLKKGYNKILRMLERIPELDIKDPKEYARKRLAWLYTLNISDVLGRRQSDKRTKLPFSPIADNWEKIALHKFLKIAVEAGHDFVDISGADPHIMEWGTQRAYWVKTADGWVVGTSSHVNAGNGPEEVRKEGLNDLERLKNDPSLGAPVKTFTDLSQRVSGSIRGSALLKLWNKMQKEDSGVIHPRMEGHEFAYNKKLHDDMKGLKAEGQKIGLTPSTIPVEIEPGEWKVEEFTSSWSGTPYFKISNDKSSSPYNYAEFDTLEEAKAGIEAGKRDDIKHASYASSGFRYRFSPEQKELIKKSKVDLFQEDDQENPHDWYTTKTALALDNPRFKVREDGTFRNGPVAKKELNRFGVGNKELDYYGLNELFDKRKTEPVHVDEIRALLAANHLMITERSLGDVVPMDHPLKQKLAEARALRDKAYMSGDTAAFNRANEDVVNLAEEISKKEHPTFYSKYSDKTGSGYREIVFTLENNPEGDWQSGLHFKGTEMNKNAIGHIREMSRVEDPVDGVGQRMEEVQSDNANDQRTAEALRYIQSQGGRMNLHPAFIYGEKGPPKTPFLEDYDKFLIRRYFRLGAERGRDFIDVTTPSVHLERYGTEDMSWITHPDGTWTVTINPQEGGGHTFSPKEFNVRDLQDLLDSSYITYPTAAAKLWKGMQSQESGHIRPREAGFEFNYGKRIPSIIENDIKDVDAQKIKMEKKQIDERTVRYYLTPEVRARLLGLKPTLFQENEAENPHKSEDDEWYTTKSEAALYHPKLQIKADGTFKSGLLAQKEFTRLGVGAKEMEALGLKKFFEENKDKPVHRDDVQAVLDANRLVITETTLGKQVAEDHPLRLALKTAQEKAFAAEHEYNLAGDELRAFENHHMNKMNWGPIHPISKRYGVFPEGVEEHAELKKTHDELSRRWLELAHQYQTHTKEATRAKDALERETRPAKYGGFRVNKYTNYQNYTETIYQMPDKKGNYSYSAHHFYGENSKGIDLKSGNFGWTRQTEIEDSADGKGEILEEVQSDQSHDLRDRAARAELQKIELEENIKTTRKPEFAGLLAEREASFLGAIEEANKADAAYREFQAKTFAEQHTYTNAQWNDYYEEEHKVIVARRKANEEANDFGMKYAQYVTNKTVAESFDAPIEELHRKQSELIRENNRILDEKRDDGTRNIPSFEYTRNHAIINGIKQVIIAREPGRMMPEFWLEDNWDEFVIKRYLQRVAQRGLNFIDLTTPEAHVQRWGSDALAWKRDADGTLMVKSSSGLGGKGIESTKAAARDWVEQPREWSRASTFRQFRDIAENAGIKPLGLLKAWKKIQKETEGIVLPRLEGQEFFYGNRILKLILNAKDAYGNKVGLQQKNAPGVEKKYEVVSTPHFLPNKPDRWMIKENGEDTGFRFATEDEANAAAQSLREKKIPKYVSHWQIEKFTHPVLGDRWKIEDPTNMDHENHGEQFRTEVAAREYVKLIEEIERKQFEQSFKKGDPLTTRIMITPEQAEMLAKGKITLFQEDDQENNDHFRTQPERKMPSPFDDPGFKDFIKDTNIRDQAGNPEILYIGPDKGLRYTMNSPMDKAVYVKASKILDTTYPYSPKEWDGTIEGAKDLGYDAIVYPDKNGGSAMKVVDEENQLWKAPEAKMTDKGWQYQDQEVDHDAFNKMYQEQIDRAKKALKNLNMETEVKPRQYDAVDVINTLSAYLKANLLTNPATHMTNVVSNALFAGLREGSAPAVAIADILTGLYAGTKQRTRMFSPRASLEGLKGAFRGKDLASLIPEGLSAEERAAAEAAVAKGMDPRLEIDMRNRNWALGGLRRAFDILKGDRDSDIEGPQRQKIDWKNNHFLQAMEDYAETVYKALGAEDAIFNAMHLHRSIAEQSHAWALTEQKRGELPEGMTVKERAIQIENSPPEEIVAAAVTESLLMTFNNQNFVSEAAHNFYKMLEYRAKTSTLRGKVGWTVIRFGLDQIMPFTRTPTNILERSLDYTPIGLTRGALMAHGLKQMVAQGAMEKIVGKELVRKEQSEAARLIGSGGMGSLVWLGFAGAAAGVFNSLSPGLSGKMKNAFIPPQTEEEKGERRFRAISNLGYDEFRVNALGQSWNGQMMGPVGAIFGSAIRAGEAWRDSHSHNVLGKGTDALWGGITGLALALKDNPYMEGPRTVLDAVAGEKQDRINVQAGLFNRMFPASGLAGAIARNPYYDRFDRKADTFTEMAKSNWPVLRKQVPIREDQYTGEDKENKKTNFGGLEGSIPSRIAKGVGAALLPFSPNKNLTEQPVINAVYQNQIPPADPHQKKGETDEAYNKRRQVAKKTWFAGIEKAIADPRYAELPDWNKTMKKKNEFATGEKPTNKREFIVWYIGKTGPYSTTRSYANKYGIGDVKPRQQFDDDEDE